MKNTFWKSGMLFMFLVLVSNVAFSVSPKAIEYYSAGELSYKSGDYENALKNYEMALQLDSTIEGYDPYVKFKMGISAYMLGDYSKAKSYLSGYNSSFVRELLDSVNKRQAQDEWKKWIVKNKPAYSEVSTSVVATSSQKKSTSITTVLVTIAIFLTVFSALLYAEYRIFKLKRKIIVLPNNSAAPSGESANKSVPIVESPLNEGKKLPVQEDNALSLLPENVKFIDFEKLINSEIDAFNDLFEERSITQSAEYTPLIEGEESQTTDESKHEESIEERIDVLESVLEESKKLIEELAETTQIPSRDEQHIGESDLAEVETKLILKLNEYKESQGVNMNQIEAELLEEIQKDLSHFDDLEKITDYETEIFVKKLLMITGGETN
ncbi:MAG: tetratricopeptide repeat protein [Fervidobacterium sp.]